MSLDQQLRNFGQHLEASSRSIDIEEIRARGTAVPIRSSAEEDEVPVVAPRRFRLQLTAAALLLLVIGGLVVTQTSGQQTTTLTSETPELQRPRTTADDTSPLLARTRTEVGPSETPVGTIRWTRLDIDGDVAFTQAGVEAALEANGFDVNGEPATYVPSWRWDDPVMRTSTGWFYWDPLALPAALWISADNAQWEVAHVVQYPDHDDVGFVGGAVRGARGNLVYDAYFADSAVLWVGEIQPDAPGPPPPADEEAPVSERELTGGLNIHQVLGEDVPGFGSVVWTALTGEGDPSVHQDHDGYVISGFTDGLLYSNDGIGWTRDALSPELEGFERFESNGKWWATAFANGERVSLLSDGGSWHEVNFTRDDGSELEENEPPHPAIESNGLWVVQDARVGGYWLGVAGDLSYHRVPAIWPVDTEPIWIEGESLSAPPLRILAASGGGFVAFAGLQDRDHPMRLDSFEVWTSTNGVEWTNRGKPSFVDEDYHGIPISTSGGMFIAMQDCFPTNMVTPPADPEVAIAGPCSSSDQPEFRRFVSGDGVEWAALGSGELLPGTDDELGDARTRGNVLGFGVGFRVSNDDGRSWTTLTLPSGFGTNQDGDQHAAVPTGDVLWAAESNPSADAGSAVLYVASWR